MPIGRQQQRDQRKRDAAATSGSAAAPEIDRAMPRASSRRTPARPSRPDERRPAPLPSSARDRLRFARAASRDATDSAPATRTSVESAPVPVLAAAYRRTTPTTVNHGPFESAAPNLKRLPTASCPGHRRRAITSLMTVAFGALAPSAAVIDRPLSNGVPTRFEKLRSDLVAPKPNALRHRARAALHRDRLLWISADEELAGNRGPLDTRNASRLLEHALEVIHALRSRPETRTRELQRQHAVGVESRDRRC